MSTGYEGVEKEDEVESKPKPIRFTVDTQTIMEGVILVTIKLEGRSIGVCRLTSMRELLAFKNMVAAQPKED